VDVLKIEKCIILDILVYNEIKMDEFVIRKIFEILYEDYELESIMNLRYISKIYDEIGSEYEKKYYQREHEEFLMQEAEDEKYWNEQAEWLKNNIPELKNEFYL